jgi:hypothetical protein
MKVSERNFHISVLLKYTFFVQVLITNKTIIHNNKKRKDKNETFVRGIVVSEVCGILWE